MAPLPHSLYAETARPAIATPPLDGSRRVSVAVIGGGFTGLSAALHLAQAGTEVTLIEAHEPGWGASGRNGGQVNPGLKHDPDEVERDFGPDLGARMNRLSGDAPNLVFDLIRSHQIQCEARQGGTLRAAFADKQAEMLRATVRQWMRRDAPVELLERAAIRDATATDRYVSAMLDRRGGTLNPLGYSRGLAEAAQRAGARIHGNTPATRIERRASRWVVETPEGALDAEHLVIATNAYTDDLWPGLRRSVVPVFSGIVATEQMPRRLAARLLAEGASLYEVGQITVYYRIDVEGRMLMGGRSPMRDINTVDPLRYLVRYTERLWPDLKGMRWTHGWSGQLAVTTDHYPHLHEPADNVLICLGYNGRGVAMATAMGREIARRVLGTQVTDLDMPVTALRTIPLHTLWRSAAAARIVYGRFRDALGL
jgi:glycine/D-amino acid oxidase-like deaminating enzyme